MTITKPGANFRTPDAGRREEAITEYDEAIRLDAQYADAYVNRGASYDRLGEYQRAIQDYDKAIQLDPDYVMAYVGRALTYVIWGQDAKADADKAKATTSLSRNG